ncbi:MAG: hypothetical protein EOO90_03005 [Pedobacter sp.]|nr:MAG: hypothetical protein EOO90_03005 [Pedobacter sp.]
MEKKYLVAVIVVLVAAFGVYALKYPPVSEKSTGVVSAFASLQGESKPSKPSTLSMGLIQEMVNNYRNTQLISIENASKNPVKADAHSILFDIDTLKKFISDIERGVKENLPAGSPKLAVRMYYAGYPDKVKWSEPGYKDLAGLLGNEIPKLYEKKHTIIMIPVIKNDKGVFADFNPFDLKTYQGFPHRTAKSTQLFRGDPTDTTQTLGLNHGQLIPPASNIGEGF